MFKLEECDPGLKLVLTVSMIIIAALSTSAFINVVLLVIILGIELISEKTFKNFKTLFFLVLMVSSQIFIINLLFGRQGQVIFSWGLLVIYDGFVSTAVLVSLRMMVISFSAFQYGSHTDPLKMAQMLVNFRVPYRYAMLIPMTARFFPVMVNAYHSISESQSTRGVPCDRIGEKIANMPAIILPLIYRSLRIANDAALSVELRGFGRDAHRTFVYQPKRDDHQDFIAG